MNYPDDIHQFDNHPDSPFRDNSKDIKLCDGCECSSEDSELRLSEDDQLYCDKCIAIGFNETLKLGKYNVIVTDEGLFKVIDK